MCELSHQVVPQRDLGDPPTPKDGQADARRLRQLDHPRGHNDRGGARHVGRRLAAGSTVILHSGVSCRDDTPPFHEGGTPSVPACGRWDIGAAPTGVGKGHVRRRTPRRGRILPPRCPRAGFSPWGWKVAQEDFAGAGHGRAHGRPSACPRTCVDQHHVRGVRRGRGVGGGIVFRCCLVRWSPMVQMGRFGALLSGPGRVYGGRNGRRKAARPVVTSPTSWGVGVEILVRLQRRWWFHTAPVRRGVDFAFRPLGTAPGWWSPRPHGTGRQRARKPPPRGCCRAR